MDETAPLRTQRLGGALKRDLIGRREDAVRPFQQRLRRAKEAGRGLKGACKSAQLPDGG